MKRLKKTALNIISFGLVAIFSVTLIDKFKINIFSNKDENEVIENEVDTIEDETIKKTNNETISTQINTKKSKVIDSNTNNKNNNNLLPNPDLANEEKKGTHESNRETQSSPKKINDKVNSYKIINTVSKDTSLKNIAFLVIKNEKIDNTLIANLNYKFSKSNYSCPNLFNNYSVKEFESFSNPSKEFIKRISLNKYIDSYLICSIQLTKIPNTFERNRYSSLVSIESCVLVKLNKNQDATIKYYEGNAEVRGNGITQKLANKNALDKFKDLINKFVIKENSN